MAETIVCYGDSNTYGYAPRSFMGERYPKENPVDRTAGETHRMGNQKLRCQWALYSS